MSSGSPSRSSNEKNTSTSSRSSSSFGLSGRVQYTSRSEPPERIVELFNSSQPTVHQSTETISQPTSDAERKLQADREATRVDQDRLKEYNEYLARLSSNWSGRGTASVDTGHQSSTAGTNTSKHSGRGSLESISEEP
ncbi:hypothetical protein CI109_101079 [Kwoniella shandongensis]|uniref:Uncharacterized protein n=1 Tax=Kwoniella shandongensis TaxID=1734106 RepID=A0A5M6C8P8_9TREE|nr:uncharacterized protein CI109_001548 [Kwoniella shandongensis]KAA5530142.1 hypothetical protein CI109_001548 [Kwoniella shandongensis]